ncbi:DUF5763 domain-containing protein [Flavobacterium sp. NG2]|uniref:DUF5763 domain-containing protein n=1 Tax=Flavobacterium sp. NG2 TaxID=3097547 RepID=UPI002A820041|nr:DUF5763 domain-containing protein [Flavobacterium sp. NG2]WPR70864.1 DUF5763 domain-containing protein [Flavobacterium sp. NG2]
MKYFKILCFLLFTYGVKSQNVYKTPSGAKYHLASCRMVNNVSQVIPIASAVEIGLEPCKICKPPISIRSNLASQNRAKGESSTVQCRGTTKAGTRCKHRTSIANGYCFQHNPD